MKGHRIISFVFIYLSLLYSKNLVLSADPDDVTETTSTDTTLVGLAALAGDSVDPTSAEEPAAEFNVEVVAASEDAVAVPEEVVTPAEDQAPENHVHFSPALVEINGLKLVDLDIVNFASNPWVVHTFDRSYHLHKFSCQKGHVFGSVKESLGKDDLALLPKDPFYKSLLDLKSHDASHFDSAQMVDGAYRWNDTLVLLEQRKAAEAPEETKFFVTVELDRMESTADVDYAFDNDQNVHVFAAKKPLLIDSVKLHGDFVWVYDDNVRDRKFPFSVEFNGSDKIEIGFKEFFLSFKKDDQGNWAVEKIFYENEDILEDAEDEEVDVEAGDADLVEVAAAEEPNAEVIEVKENEGAAPEPAAEPEVDQQLAEEAVTTEADQQLALSEGEAEPVAVAEPLLDDHLVEALEWVWKQNLSALDENLDNHVFAEHVYVKSKGWDKTVYIFFTDKSMRLFHRVGRFGPWREWVPRAKKALVAV